LQSAELIEELQDVREPASCSWCSTGFGHIEQTAVSNRILIKIRITPLWFYTVI